jgi:hypothetical protein
MYRELVTSIDAASPMCTFRVEANLISLGRVDALKADLRRANGQRVAVNDSWHARCGLAKVDIASRTGPNRSRRPKSRRNRRHERTRAAITIAIGGKINNGSLNFRAQPKCLRSKLKPRHSRARGFSYDDPQDKPAAGLVIF